MRQLFSIHLEEHAICIEFNQRNVLKAIPKKFHLRLCVVDFCTGGEIVVHLLLSEFEFLWLKSFTRREYSDLFTNRYISDSKCVKRFETSNPVWLIYKIVIKWLSCSNHTEFLQKCLTRARSQWNLFNERSLSHTRRVRMCVYRHKNKYHGERLNLSVRQGQLNFYSIKLVSESSRGHASTHAGGSKNGLKNVWNDWRRVPSPAFNQDTRPSEKWSLHNQSSAVRNYCNCICMYPRARPNNVIRRLMVTRRQQYFIRRDNNSSLTHMRVAARSGAILFLLRAVNLRYVERETGARHTFNI